MSVNKRLVQYHLSRLKDKSPEVRLKAIAELTELADPETLETLQELFKSDPDLEVRKAAQQAGRQIFLKQQEGQAKS